MVSERLQRRIDRLLDQAEDAADSRRWSEVLESARAVLALDDQNEDALGLMKMVEAALPGAGAATSEPHVEATPSAPSLPSSFVAGRYRVERFLGEGGRKRVFLAHDTTLDRDIAFAQIRTEGLDDLARERVMREAQSMARLGAHPNLVAIHDIGEEGGNPHLVEEYMAGGTVSSLLEDGTPDVERTLAVATDVCRALSFMHGQGLIHRDLKPANIFLTEDGTAKVGDFGLAVALDRSRITQQGSLVGTAAYMPPEQALGGEVTPQSDLYALGAMLYELVTGRPPFVGDDPTAIISQHINTPPVAPSWHTENCPPELEGLILLMLQKDPSERPESADSLLASLNKVNPEEKAKRHTDSNVLDRLAHGAFVGRDSELTRLRSAFDQAFAGHGNLVMLVGEPGIGKTRTSQELETFARMRGARVFAGKTHESAGMPSYFPWIEIGNAWGAADGDWDALQIDPAVAGELLRVFPGLAQLSSNLMQPEEAPSPEMAQFRLFDAYTSFVRAVSEQQPLVLVLDDLHWADRPTLQLLQHVARSLARVRVLIIGTFRDTDITRQSSLSETLAALNRDPGMERIVLRGLTREEVGGYINATTGIEVPAALVSRIHDETEGIPFFLSEVVKLMTQEGVFERDSLTDSMSDIAIPDGVKEALGRRLDRLSDAANRLLQMASVMGRDFRFDTLSALEDFDEDGLFALLEEGLEARVIEEGDGAGRYRFTHALMQETLLAELSTTRRVRLHGRIGDALEARWGDRAEERATRLAGHFVEAATLTERHAERAFRYSKLAADQARAQAGWGEAARRYEDCLTILADSDGQIEADEAELLLAAGSCHFLGGDRESAHRRLPQAADAFARRSNAEGMARAAFELNRTRVSAEVKVRMLEQALQTLDASQPEIEARLRARLAHPRIRSAVTDHEEHAKRAAQLAGVHDLADVKATLAQAQALELVLKGDFDTASAKFLEAHEMYAGLGLHADAARAISEAFIYGVLTGDVHSSVALGERGILYAQAHRLGIYEVTISAYLCNLLGSTGDLEGRDALFDANRGAEAEIAFARIRSHLELGNVADARQELSSLPEPGGDSLIDAITALESARVYVAVGDMRAAVKAFESMREFMGAAGTARDFNGISIDYQVVTGLDVQGIKLADEEFLRAWARCYAELENIADITPYGNSMRVIYGHVSLALGDVDTAEEQFTLNLEWAEREGARPIAGRCHQGLADIAIARGDPPAAMGHLDAAAEIFSEFGLNLYLDQVIAKKLELQGIGSGDTLTSIDSIAAAVQSEHPDLAPQAAPDGTVTLMFSDIIDSTATNERLGDAAWMALLREHNEVIREQLAQHGGYEVKSMGDGFMLAFGSARDGLNCAIGIQRAIAARNDSADEPVEVRIGLHTGEAVQEAGDFFGKHVNLAARIGGSATGGEILVSSLLAQLVGPSGEFTLSERPAVSLKGLDGEHVTHGVEWR